MARLHSRKKGKSGSTKPIKKVRPSWVRYGDKEAEQLVIKLAKQGYTQSKIGIALRDIYGIPDVRTITNKNISFILKENKLSSEIPEDALCYPYLFFAPQPVILKELALSFNPFPVIRALGPFVFSSLFFRMPHIQNQPFYFIIFFFSQKAIS